MLHGQTSGMVFAHADVQQQVAAVVIVLQLPLGSTA
jgi:hypothetical protein